MCRQIINEIVQVLREQRCCAFPERLWRIDAFRFELDGSKMIREPLFRDLLIRGV